MFINNLRVFVLNDYVSVFADDMMSVHISNDVAIYNVAVIQLWLFLCLYIAELQKLYLGSS